jgi:hypothetical protein
VRSGAPPRTFLNKSAELVLTKEGKVSKSAGARRAVPRPACGAGAEGSRAEQSRVGAEQQYFKPRLTTEGDRRPAEK